MPVGIFFDTNSFKNKNIAHDSQLSTIVDHSRQYGLSLLISRVVCLELENQRDREVKYIQKFYKNWRSVFRLQANMDINELELKDYSPDEAIYDPLRHHGFTILDNAVDDISVAVNSLYKGIKPAKKQNGTEVGEVHGVTKRGEIEPFNTTFIDFNYKDNALKDVFIWRSLFTFVKRPDFASLALITDNSSDFCDSVNKRCLHPHLIGDIGEEASANITVFANMQDFIDYHVEFINNFSIVILAIIDELPYGEPIEDYSDEGFYPSGIETSRILEITGICRFSALLKVTFSNSELNQQRDVGFLVSVARNAQLSGKESYSVNIIASLDEAKAAANGWSWPMIGDELLSKLQSLKMKQAVEEGNEV